jgi:hypothetical protein
VKIVVVIGLGFMPWLVYLAKFMLYPLEYVSSLFSNTLDMPVHLNYRLYISLES